MYYTNSNSNSDIEDEVNNQYEDISSGEEDEMIERVVQTLIAEGENIR